MQLRAWECNFSIVNLLHAWVTLSGVWFKNSKTGKDTDIDGVDVLPNEPSHLFLHFWGVHKLGSGERGHNRSHLWEDFKSGQ